MLNINTKRNQTTTMLSTRDVDDIIRKYGLIMDVIIVWVCVYGTNTLNYSHVYPFGLRTNRVISGCPIREYDEKYHAQYFQTMDDLVRALHTIPGEFRVIHVNMVNGDWESNEMCGIPISSDEEKTPRSRDEYIDYITRRGLYASQVTSS